VEIIICKTQMIANINFFAKKIANIIVRQKIKAIIAINANIVIILLIPIIPLLAIVSTTFNHSYQCLHVEVLV